MYYPERWAALAVSTVSAARHHPAMSDIKPVNT